VTLAQGEQTAHTCAMAWFRKLSRFLSQLGFSLGIFLVISLLYKSLQSDRLRVNISSPNMRGVYGFRTATFADFLIGTKVKTKTRIRLLAMSKAEKEKRLDGLNQKLGITHLDKLTEYYQEEMERN
jgi:hypothetical protein